MARMVGIAGVQMKVAPGQDNTERMLKRLNAIARLFPWVDVVFFSELCLSGVRKDLAMPYPNAPLERIARWAKEKGKWVLPGSFYETDGPRIFNTAVVVSPGGEVVARYRKLFPWHPLEVSDPGEEFCVFDIAGKGCFGLCICYDQWFPEVARTLAWLGAEAVFCPTATFTPDREQEQVMARANAIANQFYWFSLNGVGAGGIGRSVFVDPEGRVLQQAGEGERIMTEIIDLDLVARVREYGTAGHCQVWKSLQAFKGSFPVYRDEKRDGAVYQHLQGLRLHRSLKE
jgi:predicted amidohydrolase